jgi:hypothetical protein
LNGNALVQSVYNLRKLKTELHRFDAFDAGAGTISGVTTVENVPKSRRVRLYLKQDGRLVRETFSNSVGQYSFVNLNPALEYFVVAHDHLRVYNAVISDMVKP